MVQGEFRGTKEENKHYNRDRRRGEKRPNRDEVVTENRVKIELSNSSC